MKLFELMLFCFLLIALFKLTKFLLSRLSRRSNEVKPSEKNFTVGSLVDFHQTLQSNGRSCDIQYIGEIVELPTNYPDYSPSDLFKIISSSHMYQTIKSQESYRTYFIRSDQIRRVFDREISDIEDEMSENINHLTSI